MSIASIFETTSRPFTPAAAASRTPSAGFKPVMASAVSAAGSNETPSSETAAAENSSGSTVYDWYSQRLHASSGDQAWVTKFVKSIASDLDTAPVRLPQVPGGPATYTFTGQTVTAGTTAEFDARAREALAGRQAIYNDEMAKGTLPADIYDKMAAYMRFLPDENFKLQSGWSAPMGSAA